MDMDWGVEAEDREDVFGDDFHFFGPLVVVGVGRERLEGYVERPKSRRPREPDSPHESFGPTGTESPNVSLRLDSLVVDSSCSPPSLCFTLPSFNPQLVGEPSVSLAFPALRRSSPGLRELSANRVHSAQSRPNTSPSLSSGTWLLCSFELRLLPLSRVSLRVGSVFPLPDLDWMRRVPDPQFRER